MVERCREENLGSVEDIQPQINPSACTVPLLGHLSALAHSSVLVAHNVPCLQSLRFPDQGAADKGTRAALVEKCIFGSDFSYA